eukprot:COSAG04_NODE_4006_length_2364_cov_2.170861_2_plen_166_part_00
MAEGSLVLVDAAAELGGTRVGGGYASDITRTWPCSGTFTPKQRGVHDVVNAAVEAGLANAVEGSSFSAASLAASHAILAGLLELGLCQGGSVEELHAAGIHSLFMPHSLGYPNATKPTVSRPFFARFAPCFRRSFALSGFLAPGRRERAKNGGKWAKFGGETGEK